MKMVTYFNRTDLVKFGQYLLSEERRERFKQTEIERPDCLPLEERLSMVHNADLANWLEDQRSNQ